MLVPPVFKRFLSSSSAARYEVRLPKVTRQVRVSLNSNEGGIPTNPNILNVRVEGLVCDKCCKWFSHGNFPNMEKLVLAVDGDVREFMVTHSKLRMIEFECYQNK